MLCVRRDRGESVHENDHHDGIMLLLAIYVRTIHQIHPHIQPSCAHWIPPLSFDINNNVYQHPQVVQKIAAAASGVDDDRAAARTFAAGLVVAVAFVLVHNTVVAVVVAAYNAVVVQHD